jgi:type II restriction enzyme
MKLIAAKTKLDQVIKKSRVHFYKPFQIAEILRHHRIGQLLDLTDLESYRNRSKQWRNEVSQLLVGRISTSSARYQDDLFTACSPDALAALGAHNIVSGGEVELYIYRMFESKVAPVSEILQLIRAATPATFNLTQLVNTFESKPGLKRSIDKVFEIIVYALFSTVVRALRLEMSLKIVNTDRDLIKKFERFLETVVGMKKGSTSFTLPASLFRLGSTNAADRGLDMIANFGPAIQVKHLTLDVDAIADICDGLSADRIVIVCKDVEAATVDAFVTQMGLRDRLQGIVKFSDLENWYKICLSTTYQNTLGKTLLTDFINEFTNEFPSFDGLADFMKKNSYSSMKLSQQWVVSQ